MDLLTLCKLNVKNGWLKRVLIITFAALKICRFYINLFWQSSRTTRECVCNNMPVARIISTAWILIHLSPQEQRKWGFRVNYSRTPWHKLRCIGSYVRAQVNTANKRVIRLLQNRWCRSGNHTHILIFIKCRIQNIDSSVYS